MFLALISWIFVGTLIGFIASKNIKLHGDDPKLGIACGAVGAVTGGILYRIVTKAELGFNLWSILSAAIAATIVLAAWHFMRRRAARA